MVISIQTIIMLLFQRLFADFQLWPYLRSSTQDCCRSLRNHAAWQPWFMWTAGGRPSGVIQHGTGKWTISRWFSELETSSDRVFFKHGWLANPGTEWRFLARKITEISMLPFPAVFDDTGGYCMWNRGVEWNVASWDISYEQAYKWENRLYTCGISLDFQLITCTMLDGRR